MLHLREFFSRSTRLDIHPAVMSTIGVYYRLLLVGSFILSVSPISTERYMCVLGYW